MYNRYIPRSDGTYSRKSIPDRPPETPKPPPPVPPEVCESCVRPEPPRRQAPRPARRQPPQSVGSFLRQLLPRDFDTEDLIIVLLLLLMAGDDREEQNYALLTLALYLFL